MLVGDQKVGAPWVGLLKELATQGPRLDTLAREWDSTASSTQDQERHLAELSATLARLRRRLASMPETAPEVRELVAALGVGHVQVLRLRGALDGTWARLNDELETSLHIRQECRVACGQVEAVAPANLGVAQACWRVRQATNLRELIPSTLGRTMRAHERIRQSEHLLRQIAPAGVRDWPAGAPGT